MKGQKALFSHKGDEWETPKWLFDKLDKEFHFNCDAACTVENRKCDTFYDINGDALNPNADWNNIAFLNPPYSKIAAFMKKAYEESLKGATVVCLIPCRTDTRYWHDYCMKASEIRLIKGRLKFTNQNIEKTTSATFPSCIVVFDERMARMSTPYPVLYSMVKE
ncbi:MAG TPA: DNA N-6-adenine-methyltransferase [Candidatus Thermoplasmatota archaeon]|nr:DNA N-6-adenine-methyltransferase [Candidatus Thermoplasmatota archaeon]